ncbi:Predicted DNA-binding protein, MmcQ/YjbR family [Duganella sp. CF517]|uniref:MmcQ/YjbR family DNA-binding protein n=1 Tax=Duganella sp. CF517 TaxID=1881038 RepID=UPI0008B5F8B4|nr:MmcQ/YjbR family DNA-binding protein [Duganella sp. CF517]SEO28437.1 Predicted DNA-binding protein, MmcQ/YjbR family [Duganella sp. CF517]
MNIKQAKTLCRSLPGATEDVKWETNLVFSVGGKMFAVTENDDKAKGISFKVDDDRFLELTDRPGIILAPYLARARWVYVEELKSIGDAEAAELLKRSYELVFAKLTKKLQREIGGQQ